jgi:hypothetical protein
MRKIGIAVLLTVAVGGCNRGNEAEVSAATDANLLDEATVNAILGAGIPPEDLLGDNRADGNGTDNAADEAENQQ